MFHLSSAIALFQGFLFLTVSAKVTIMLKPMIDNVPDEVLFEGINFFEPVLNPDETRPRSCDQSECGGQIPIDLSSDDRIEFHWVASTDGTKYISLSNSDRVRVEFLAEVDCDLKPNSTIDIVGNDIMFNFDGMENLGVREYQYNLDSSFILLGKMDGSSKCEIFTRLQFDPVADGAVELAFKSLQFSGSYNSQEVVMGKQEYEWSTQSYCWIRGENFEILSLPSSSPSVRTVVANVYGVTILSMAFGGMMIFFA